MLCGLLCFFGASSPLILSHIARYAPSSERKIRIQINHKLLLSDFEHLLIYKNRFKINHKMSLLILSTYNS